MKTIEVQYAQEKNNRASRKITSYKMLTSRPLCRLIPVKTIYIEKKDWLDTSGIPLEQVTDADIPEDEDFVHRISKNGLILELPEKAFERFKKLYDEDNAYIHDEWNDVPALGHGYS